MDEMAISYILLFKQTIGQPVPTRKNALRRLQEEASLRDMLPYMVLYTALNNALVPHQGCAPGRSGKSTCSNLPWMVVLSSFLFRLFALLPALPLCHKKMQKHYKTEKEKRRTKGVVVSMVDPQAYPGVVVSIGWTPRPTLGWWSR